ncbi:hypothetical protein BKA66DRAFT_579460 [Pyrenochaeta sp. MPI-SDFR-AT-0127]|nr:hypothetical protein BKA66DRAFT_579460 [Pyrenochaeta sp. MPI-SDFR-AT-0127]
MLWSRIKLRPQLGSSVIFGAQLFREIDSYHSQVGHPGLGTSVITISEFPLLRRVRGSVPWRLWIIAIIGLWERAAFWGKNYMEHPPHNDNSQTPGALGLGQANATRIYCAFYIFYYITPLILAPLAGSYLCQYPALLISVMLYCFGCTALTVSSVKTSLDKGWCLPGLILAMILIGLGGGAVRKGSAQTTSDKTLTRTISQVQSHHSAFIAGQLT